MADEVEQVFTRDIVKELSFTPWLAKVNERVRLALECIKDKRDGILETDYDILQAMHKLWFEGEAPIYQTITIPNLPKPTQPSLFDDKTTDSTEVTTDNSTSFDDARDKILDGTILENEVEKPKKKKR